MRYLVTGGAGFIGSAFVTRPPLGHVCEFTVLDRLTYAGNPKYIESALVNGNAQLVAGDIADEKLVYHLLYNVDAVVHFAAESHNTRSEKNPDIFHQTNVEGTRHLMNAVRRFLSDHPDKKIHVTYVSTDEVYGPAKPGAFFKEDDFDRPENQPTSAYSWSKYKADLMVRTWFADLRPLVVRPTNNFGPCQHPEKALPRWICAAIDGRPIEVWGEGLQVRDWLYTRNTARAIYSAIAKGVVGALNLGANHDPEITNIEMAHMVIELLGADESLITFVPDPRPNHDFRYGVDISRFNELRLVGKDVWHDRFRASIRETVKWYRNNEAIWRPLIAEAEALYQDKEKS